MQECKVECLRCSICVNSVGNTESKQDNRVAASCGLRSAEDTGHRTVSWETWVLRLESGHGHICLGVAGHWLGTPARPCHGRALSRWHEPLWERCELVNCIHLSRRRLRRAHNFTRKMTTLIKDGVCGTHSMKKAFAVVSAEIQEKLGGALSHEFTVSIVHTLISSSALKKSPKDAHGHIKMGNEK